jgi:cell division transport system permease protein
MTPAASCSMTAASMSMTSPAAAVLRNTFGRLRRGRRADDQARPDAALVPKESIAGSALVAVVAIMTFLAALTSGGVAMLIGSAGEWQSAIAREMTIQVRPIPGRDIEADVATAVKIARATAGIADVRPYSRQESEALLEPWIGSGLSLEDLPVPRMIAIRAGPGITPDLAALRRALATADAAATLDDHRGWIDRMRRMARTAIIGGLAILGLVLAATILSVAFATRGAMASNRPIVEVLHIVGAKEAYIANQFQRHFLTIGLKGGAIGGGTAMLLFAAAEPVSSLFAGSAGATEAAALFGSFSIGPLGYVAVIAEVVLIALITAATSRQVVLRTLRRID